jgi:hypothetical protein
VRGAAFTLLAPLAGPGDESWLSQELAWIKTTGVAIGKAIGFLVALATGVSVIIGIWFILRPNTEPVTEQSVEISTLAITRDVTLGEFSRYPFIRDLAHTVWDFPDPEDPASDLRGSVADVNYSLKGFPKGDVNLRWSLFDARTNEHIADSEDVDPFCLYSKSRHLGPWCVAFTAVFRTNEVSSFAFWIDTASTNATCVFVRIEIYRRSNRLTFKDSPVFEPPSARKKGNCVGRRASKSAGSKRVKTVTSNGNDLPET